jgi:hypothetical protein
VLLQLLLQADTRCSRYRDVKAEKVGEEVVAYERGGGYDIGIITKRKRRKS